MDIEALARWSEPREVQTKYGPRFLRKAKVTNEFSKAWETNKDELKKAGATFSKTQSGEWELAWWLPLPDSLVRERKESVEASKAASADIDLPHPPGLDYMPFQKAGIKFALERPNVLFADQMGLGKTIEAIGVINADETIHSVIIVCPKSLKLNWRRELERWLVRPLSIGIANGVLPNTNIVIVNYEGLLKIGDIDKREFDLCIVDEAHFIKNRKAKRSMAVKSINARRKLRLTGTPIVNRPAELYNLIEDLHPNFKNFFSFAKRYCGAGYGRFGWDVSGATNLDELQTRLRETVMIRRLKEQVLAELPRKIRQVVEFEPDSTETKSVVLAERHYEDASEEELESMRLAVELAKAESEEAYRQAVAQLREASQVHFTEISRLRHETALAKLSLVMEHLKNAMADDDDYKIIVAAHHRDVIAKISEMAQAEGWNPVTLTGENNERERQEAVDAFQNDKSVRLFIGSITAAGVGITLTASNHVVFAELDWVPGNVSQFEDRAHRIGQTNTVLVQHLVLNESLDARMAKIIVRKQEIIDSALDKEHPERQQPVYEPPEEKKAASHNTTFDQLTHLAQTLTEEQIESIHAGLRFLAGLDTDYARALNRVGFSKIDVGIGHSLARWPSLTPKQAALGLKLCHKYRRQLPVDISISIGIEQ